MMELQALDGAHLARRALPDPFRQFTRSATWYRNIRFFIQRTASKS